MLAWGFAMTCQAINCVVLFRFYTYKCILESQKKDTYRFLSGGQTGFGSLRLKIMFSKTCLKRLLKKKMDYRLMQVKNIAECSKRAFCNTFDLH